MSLLDTLLEAARYIEQQERRLLAEEEPKSPVSLRMTELSVTCSNGIRPKSPMAVVTAATTASASLVTLPVSRVPLVDPTLAPVVAQATALSDFVQEHSTQRVTNNHGSSQIPSPLLTGTSNCATNGNVPRAGTREVHNKLEKNRRAHLKECFELLKRQLPATPDDKKTSNLSILGSAIRYIQVLRRKERECEHEMERLAREKIAAQQRLANLKRDTPLRPASRIRCIETVVEESERCTSASSKGVPSTITSSPPRPSTQAEVSSPHTLNLSTKLRTVPLQISPISPQVVGTTYGTRHNTLTLTTLAPLDTSSQSCQESSVTKTLSTLVHPAQIHLPISQVVSNGSLVVGPAHLQFLSTNGLRVLQAPSVHSNGVVESCGIAKENGMVSPPTASTESVVVSGLGPIVVSPPTAHLLQTHTLAHKVVETQMVKGNVPPLTVSARYLSATTIVKPVVVVSSAPSTSS